MFQTIWFFVKIFAMSTFAIWLVTQEGDVTINVMSYKITTQAGFFLLSLLISFLVLLTLYRFIRSLMAVPKNLVAYSQASQRKKSFRALTRGLVAVAAGDAKQATHYSKQTKNLWSDLRGLPLLLEAQAAKLRGEEGLAQNRFERMLKDKEVAFLGVRGLLSTALEAHDYARALEFARQAEKQHPKKPWVIRCVYELEIKNRQWENALRTNHKAKKFKAYPNQKLNADRIAIYLHHCDKAIRAGDKKTVLTEVQKAYKLNAVFVPTLTRYCDLLIKSGKNKKAIGLIEKAWKENPHPELADIWMSLAPVPKGKNREKDQAKTMAWAQRLIALKPDSADAHIMAARTAMDLDLWGEAKSYLMTAEKTYPSAQLYRLQAIVEQNSTHNEDSIHRLMERAAEAMPDKVWVCQETGIIYDSWSAIAKPHGAFNSIIWDYAGARVVGASHDILQDQSNILLI